MATDRVIAELRKIREAYALRFQGDVRAMVKDLKERQAKGGRKVVSLAPRRPPSVIPAETAHGS